MEFDSFSECLKKQILLINKKISLEISMINKGKSKGYYYAQVALQSQSDSDIAVEYEVQKILKHRLKKNYQKNYGFGFDDQVAFNRQIVNIPNNQLEFFVRWKNYGPDQQSWQPGENFQNAPEVVEQYKRQVSKPNFNSNSCNSGKPKERKGKSKEMEHQRHQGRQKPQRRNRGLRFDKIYEAGKKDVKEDEQNSDQLCIIDEADFCKGTVKAKRKKAPIAHVDGQQQKRLKLRDSPSEEISVCSKQSKRKHLEAELCPVLSRDPQFELQPEPQPRLKPRQQQFSDQQFIMPQNYCQVGLGAYIQEMPSQSLSSYLHGLSQQQKRRHQRPKQNGIQNQLNDNAIEQQQGKMQYKQALAVARLQKQRKEPDFESILDDFESDSSAQLRIKDKISQRMDSEQREIYEYKGQRIVDQHNEVHFDCELQNSGFRKRQNLFEHIPEETGQRIRKKIKPIQMEQNNESINQNKEKIYREDHFETILRQPAEITQKPIQINTKNALSQLLHKGILGEKMDQQIRPLQQAQTISLQEESAEKDNKLIQNYDADKNQQQNLQSTSESCSKCNDMKDSYDLFINYRKYHLMQMNESSCNAILQRIYEEQQTYILVNGLNPNVDLQKPDKIKKIDVLENKPFLERAIVKRVAKQEEISELVENYTLGKIVMSKGQWYAILKAEKLMKEKSHYRYVRLKDLVRCHKQRIVAYLTEQK